MEKTREKPTYEDAVQTLNSTQTGFKILEERRRRGQKIGVEDVEQMRQWLARVGHTTRDLSRLNVVHVAGTKGKGTTCAYVNSILQKYHQSVGLPRKIGLYTSPHLVAVRERIRINSEPISEDQFTRYFFEVWDALESSAFKDGHDPAVKPSYFRFLTLMSFHVFMMEGVDTAIYEVGVGGELDSTNIIGEPAVTGITTLGIDHVISLGDTIEEIAWHKAGIFKNGCPAFTVEQKPSAMEVLERRAAEKNVKLTIVEICPALRNVDISPAENFQRGNASLAISLAAAVLKRLGVEFDCAPEKLPQQFVQGLESVVWRGRCEVVRREHQNWYLDGAHTDESLEIACSWFGRVSQAKDVPRVLIFNQQSQREALQLLETVHKTIYNNFNTTFQYAIFCTNITYKEKKYKSDFVNNNADPDALAKLTLQYHLAAEWRKLDLKTEVSVLGSIEEAIDKAEKIKCEVGENQILITGSFHLVGGALSIIEGQNFALASASRK